MALSRFSAILWVSVGSVFPFHAITGLCSLGHKWRVVLTQGAWTGARCLIWLFRWEIWRPGPAEVPTTSRPETSTRTPARNTAKHAESDGGRTAQAAAQERKRAGAGGRGPQEARRTRRHVVWRNLTPQNCVKFCCGVAEVAVRFGSPLYRLMPRTMLWARLGIVVQETTATIQGPCMMRHHLGSSPPSLCEFPLEGK